MLSLDPEKRSSMASILKMDFIRKRADPFLSTHQSVDGVEPPTPTAKQTKQKRRVTLRALIPLDDPQGLVVLPTPPSPASRPGGTLRVCGHDPLKAHYTGHHVPITCPLWPLSWG